jgi:hypothetical protein
MGIEVMGIEVEVRVLGNFMLEEQLPSVRTLALATGTVGGFLIAISVQVLLGQMNFELAAMLRDLFASSTVQVKSALAWWMIAGTALVGGFLAAALTRFLLTSWWPLRLLRWILGAAMVAGLGAVAHVASEPVELDSAAFVAVNASGMVAALLAAGVGAFFAARR